MWLFQVCHLFFTPLTIRWYGSWVWLATSSSSLYSSSSHSLWRVLMGSLSCTGMATLERSLPMLFFRMFHRLTLLVGLGEGSVERRRARVTTLLTRGQKRGGKGENMRIFRGTVAHRDNIESRNDGTVVGSDFILNVTLKADVTERSSWVRVHLFYPQWTSYTANLFKCNIVVSHQGLNVVKVIFSH